MYDIIKIVINVFLGGDLSEFSFYIFQMHVDLTRSSHNPITVEVSYSLFALVFPSEQVVLYLLFLFLKNQCYDLLSRFLITSYDAGTK